MESGLSSSDGGGADSINRLKVGNKIYSGSGLRQEAETTSPAKKWRTGMAQGGHLLPLCQVEGCKADLSDAKAYYCRHKVCGMHSKSPKVIVAGIEQRFCQQCSRFHQLPEFDQGKRSCRRRLAGHNERRRKPPPGPLLSSRYESLPSSIPDNHSKTRGFVMDFSGFPTNAKRDAWPMTSSERELANQATITKKYELSWPSNSQNPVPTNLLQGPTARPDFSRPKISSEGCFNGVSNSNISALSLLSNQSWDSRTRQHASSLNVNNFIGPNGSCDDSSGSIGRFPCASWGLSAISRTSNGQFSGDVGLAPPNDRQYPDEIERSKGYDSPVNHMNWLL